MSKNSDELDELRRQIADVLGKVGERGSLLYVLWLLERIMQDGPLPPAEELRALHGAFVRLSKCFRAGGKGIDSEDLALVVKHISADRMEIARPLGMAVRFHREQRKLSRLELSKRCRMPVRAILALERGQVKDMSLPSFERLATGLGVDAGELMGTVMEFANAN